MPHPVLLRKAIVSDGEQRRRSRYAVSFQVPRVPEKKLLADDAAAVGAYLHHWSGPGNWPDEVTERYFRRAFQYRATAHCALEYHRWALRSIPRPDGVRFINRMEQPILAPVLQIQGLADGAVLPGSVDGSEDFVVGDYRREDIEGIGHFPHEEDPEAFAGLVAPWLAGMLPTASGAAPAAGRPAGR
jgi:pimeloyl-ACP methyl ester carboxylesterase